nr:hypothetical protein [Candidatus Njordarchaeota archaeon]
MADIWTILYGLLLNPLYLAIFVVVAIVLGLILGALFLMVGLGAVNGKHREFGTVFITALIGAIVNYIPIVGCILYWYMIKVRHETTWGGAIAAWLIAGLIPLAIILALFVFVIFPFL